MWNFKSGCQTSCCRTPSLNLKLTATPIMSNTENKIKNKQKQLPDAKEEEN